MSFRSVGGRRGMTTETGEAEMTETETRHDTIEGQRRWFALVVLCMGA